MQHTTALVVMAKQPRVGYTKTRLCPPFSLGQASEFYQAMLLDTLELANSLPGVQMAVAITPIESRGYFEKITPQETLLLSVEGNEIGECLVKTIDCLLKSGFTKVMALNADGPSLPREYLLQAARLLDESDIVLGPGEDGGYYLIGMKCLYPELFKGIDWSTALVLSQTLDRAKMLLLKTALTLPWYDVDTVREAARLAVELAALPLERLVHSRRFLDTLPENIWRS